MSSSEFYHRWKTPQILKARTLGRVPYTFNKEESEGLPNQWTQNNYKASSHLTSKNLTSTNSKSSQKKNLQHYTFGGMTNIRRTPLYNQLAVSKLKGGIEINPSSEADFESGREKLTGFTPSVSGQKGDFVRLNRPTRPKMPNFFDQAYNTDIRKKVKNRPMS